ncbi:hypothetical protein F183_A47010 [Bryobacterales bacterium F-183]|nr:hypothetical protein F183_A47010 [Bryobacterales bacterium F-183]
MTLRRLLWFIPASGTRRRDILGRIAIITKAAAVIGFLLACSWYVHIRWMSNHLEQQPLSLAMSFICVQVTAIILQLTISALIKETQARRATRSAAVRPVVRQHIAAHLAGSDRITELQRLMWYHRADVEICLSDALRSLTGEALSEAARMASVLGFQQSWRAARNHAGIENLSLLPPVGRKRRPNLLPPDPSLNETIAAYRSLLRCSPTADELRLLLREILASPLLVRAALWTELQPYASFLSAALLPELLAKANQGPEVEATMQLAVSLGIILPEPIWTRVLRSPSRAIRIAALRLAESQPRRMFAEAEVTRLLYDPDIDVQRTAVEMSGRMRLRSALPRVRQLLSHNDELLARKAFSALVNYGPEGRRLVRGRLLFSKDPRIAPRAAAALGPKSFVGRGA